jgi:hypothetical protein
MYISLRYAKHLAQGQGLLWNINEYPVEGYSNFTFVIIAAASIKMGLDPVLTLKLTGVLGLLLTLVALYLLSRLWLSKSEALLPCIALLLYKGQILWTVSGLETTLYQALIAFSLYFLLRGLGYKQDSNLREIGAKKSFLISGLLMALASLTRPEAPLLLLLFSGLALWDSSKNTTYSNKQGIALYILSFALIYVPYFLWRWHYFGRLLPNPLYCKGYSESQLFELDKAYLLLIWPFFLFSLPEVFRSKNRKHYFFWLPSLLYLLLLISAETLVAFDNRLFLPVFQLLLPLAFAGLHRLVIERFPFIVSSILLSLFFIPKMTLSGYSYFTKNPQAGEKLRKEVDSWLKEKLSPNSIVVLGDSGLIPYLSKLNFIDSYCLNNREMGKEQTKFMYKNFCSKVLLKNPEAIILTSLIQGDNVVYAPADVCLYKKLIQSEKYQFKKVFQAKDASSIYRYEIFMREP